MIDYFNNNAFVASIITLLLSTIINMLVISFERKLNNKESNRERKRNEKINKGEFRIDRFLREEPNDTLKLIYTDYSKNKINDRKFDCYYNKKVINKKYLDKIVIPLKNIGKINISEMYIVCNNREKTILVEEDRIKYLIKGKYPNYVVGYYKKILPSECIIIELYYYRGSKIFGTFSSELTLYYRDGYNNFYFQPIFLDEDVKIEGPYIVNSKEYLIKTSMIIE